MLREVVGIQYLRGIAAMLVVVHHLSFSNSQLGPFGVQIFFVISGFVMWLTTAALNISTISFWQRRLVRIVPLYWFFLSILVLIGLSAPHYLNTTQITWENAVKSFLFIPHFHPVQKLIAPILIPGWSLNYEMFFYFIFGIALLIGSEACRAIVIGVLFCGLVLVGWLCRPESAIGTTYTNPGLLLFVDGVVLAMVYQTKGINNAVLGGALICVGALARFIGLPSSLSSFETIIGLSPALIVAGMLSLEPTFRLRPSLVLCTVGNASYSIYLSHLFFLRLSEIGWHYVNFGSNEVLRVTYVVFAFIFAIAGGIAVHYVIERPMLLLFHQKKIATNSTRTV
jgi:exopolysaccharide production protein ExoZ